VHVVATAGHVDHGKSSLVLALTGTDPDRWPEEKARGLTIDLGFAGARLPSGRRVALVDVPGHVRFIKNMLAGVGAVDAALFVVAATEGWKPQSEEHLRILELLGIERGVVALTKAALVDADDLELAGLEIAERLAGSPLAGAEVVPVDSPTGEGVGDVAAALDRLLEATPTAADRGRPRLWIDRAFAAPGAGTVVTGTLGGGALHLEDEVVVLPSGQRARVRGLESLHERHGSLGPGHRAAVNLVGVHHRSVRRGDALVEPDRWHQTAVLDARLHVLASLDHPVSRRGAHLLYVGSGEHAVRLRVLGPDVIEPGATDLIRLRLPVALPLLPGDRFVLRDAGRGETVGGGEVLDVDPVLPASRARPDRSVERVVAERGWVEVEQLERLTGTVVEPDVGRWAVSPGALAEAEDRLRAAVADAGPLGLDLAALDDRDRVVLARLEGVAVSGGRARPAVAADPLADHPFLAALDAAPHAPPTPEEAGAARPEVRELVRRGLVVEHDGCFWSAGAVRSAGEVVAQLLARHPEGVTVAQVRDALGTSRKHAVPLLGLLDATGVTRRRGDVRIAGPRLPAAGAPGQQESAAPGRPG
jgi:selenocysteine-specific elongation factor